MSAKELGGNWLADLWVHSTLAERNLLLELMCIGKKMRGSKSGEKGVIVVSKSRLPFYRSLVFQLALPVLLFMLWAWRDSGTFSSKLFLCGRGQVYATGQYLGAIEFSHRYSWMETTMRIAPVREQHEPVHHEKYPYVRGFVFPKAIVAINRSLGEKGVRIAHWLIFVVTLIVTVLFMILRHYRHSRP